MPLVYNGKVPFGNEKTPVIKLIVYDLDGTLIDSRRDIANAVNGTLKELGLKTLPMEQVSSFVGSGVMHLMRQTLEVVTSDPARYVDCSIKLFRRRYAEHLLDETRLYPSVIKVLEFFKARKQAVITNKPEDFSVTILRELGAASYFFRIVGGDRGFPKKPDPGSLQELLRSVGGAPEETVFVGDSAIDIETGKNAGVKTVAVTYGFGKQDEIEKSQPDFILADLEELTRCPLLKS